MENQPVVLGSQDGGTVTGTAPAFYVLVKQPQTNGKADQGTLISNRDSCGLVNNTAVPIKSKVKTCLPADCTSLGITVTLDNNTMWNEFYHRNTEMILTKQGRRMFPYCRYWITGLESNLKYILVMDISPVDNFRYKWNGCIWEPSGKAEPHVLGRVFIHPESPSTGHYWMHQPVSFYKLKLTNNILDQEGHIILHSMHRYLPRLHVVPADKATEVIQLNGPDVCTFTFPQTEFFAVTAYQNIQITQLKIDYNPFAKGFRDDGLSMRPQRDIKQNGSSEHEGGGVATSPISCKHYAEADELYSEQRSLEPSSTAVCNENLEKTLLSPEHDSFALMETGAHISGRPPLMKEALKSPVASPSQNKSHVPTPLNSKGGVNIVVKEEPLDEYDYGPSGCMEGMSVKQEDRDEKTEELPDNHDSVDKQLEKLREVNRKEAEMESNKQTQNSQLGVAKAKMLTLDSGKMPVVYLEPCAVTRNTIKVSAFSQSTLSPSKSEISPFSYSVDYLSTGFENSDLSSSFTTMTSEEIAVEKQISENNTPCKCSSARDVVWEPEAYSSLTETKKGSNYIKTTLSTGLSSTKDNSGKKKTNALKTPLSCKGIVGNNTDVTGPRKRGRPRKIKLSEAGQTLKFTGKSVAEITYTSLGPCSTHLDVKPDLEDVDGVLFVSFSSKDALDIHTVDGAEEREDLQSIQTPSLASYDTCSDPDGQRIQQLEKELLQDLKSFKYKQVIHPSLQEVGLKLNFVDPTMSIDLKYLGVQLPLSYSNDCTLWKTLRTNSCCSDAGLPFVSRTGKTNDFTKIKGWRGKLHNSSKTEGSNLESSLKNRSAFCSDKLDEYLENEGKLMETNMRFSASTSSDPVIYQLPTKSTSYVRTLDSVLRKQSIVTPSSPYTFKPLSVPSVSRKKRERIKSKKQTPRGKRKPSLKLAMPLPVVTKQKRNLQVLEEKVTKSQPSSHSAEVDTLMTLSSEETVLGKETSVRQAQQQQQNNRPPSLSKTQLKLMDLEDCALWDGKPRTYITEERAELSLTTLLTAQASLKNKPIHKIIKKRAPPCNNDFCRLGCICSSLALENRQPTHCQKLDCMFGCTCLKRRVILVKGGSKRKKILEKSQSARHLFYHRKEKEQWEEETEKEEQEKLKDKKRKKTEYTLYDMEPEKPVKNFPLWVKVDGEMDPEPVYIPTPSTNEPTKLVIPPAPAALPSDIPVPSGAKPAPGGVVKPRVYTPRPNPVIREEDKDPVYLYFESMMTCARVRIYERKMQEKKQQNTLQNAEKCIEKEHSDLQSSLKMEDDKELGEKSWWFSCSAGDPSTSYVHHTTPNGTTKLIEIVSDCNWEEDRNEILNILSQHIKNKMPKSLRVGNFAIDLESESKTWDEKNAPIYSSRVKISMPSWLNKDQNVHMSVLESPNNTLSPCKRTEKVTPLSPHSLGTLQEQRKKGLPFYAGLFPAGKLTAYTCKSNLNPSCLIQVNGKNYRQAKLLLGQMGALHPANRLAAYITGRLQPTVLDLSTVSTVVSKVTSDPKVLGPEPPSVEVSASNTSKTQVFTSATSSFPVAHQYIRAPAQRPIAARPSTDSSPSQLIMNAVGALQQTIPGIKTPQPLTGPQKFNIKSIPLSPRTSAVTTAAVTVTSPSITTPSHSECKEAICSSGIGLVNTSGKSENSSHITFSPTTTMAAVTITTSTGMATPIETIAFVKSVVAASTISVSAAPLSTTASPATVTTPVSSADCVHTIPSGIQTSPLSNEKPVATPLSPVTSPPQLSPGAEKRMGPRLLLIPVHQGSPALRPPQNTQLTQGKRMILQPLRNPGGVNLYRHPNGQIIQLVPLHQFQPVGPQSSLPPVMYRNPGSVVGIQLPGPSKLPDTSVCQCTSVSAVTVTTTAISVLSMTPSASSAPLTTETTSVLSVSPTTIAAPVLPALPPSLCVSPTNGATSVVSALPATVASSVLPISSRAEATPVLLAPPTIVDPLMWPLGCSTEATSALLPSPSVSQTFQNLKSVPTTPVSTSQAAPISPPVLVPLSQAGTMTLRISPSGLKSIASETDEDSKMGEPPSVSSLIPLQIGGFALLQAPEQKCALDPTVKEVGSHEVKDANERDEFSAVHTEKTSHAEEVEALESDGRMTSIKLEENTLPDTYSEGIICDRNAIALELIKKDADVVKLSGEASGSQPDAISSDHSYLGKIKCDEIKLNIKKKQHVKCYEDTLDELPYNSENISEGCSLAHNSLGDQTDTEQLKSSSNEQTQLVETQSPANDSEGTKQTQSEMEKMLWETHKERMNSNERLGRKPKSSLSRCENLDLELLRRTKKPNGDFVIVERDKRKVKPNVNKGKKQTNISRKKYVDSAQGSLLKRDTNVQENYTVSIHETVTTGFQDDCHTVKDSLSQVNRTCSKTSAQSFSLENENMSAKEHVEKFVRCPKQNTVKTNHCRKNYEDIIDITMDDTEKDEKTDDSADETIDEVSVYPSEDIVNIETQNESEASEFEENVDIETVEELSEKINIARLKASAAHALLSKQLHIVRDHSNKTVAKSPKQTELSSKKPKNEEEAFANYRQTHTANERRRRKEMRGLFEKLEATLGLQVVPKVSKCFILKQAFEEIQGLTDQADKLTGQKNLLLRKQETLIRKVSALSGKTQEVVLKKLEYIYAKQKAVEAQKKQQQEARTAKTAEPPETAQPSSESSPSSLFREMKQDALSSKRTKPLILARKRIHAPGETSPPVNLANASLVMTAQGQVLTFKSPLMPGQIATLPSTLLQAELKSEVDSSSGTMQPGIASVMIQLPGSTVPVQVKGILPTSTVPLPLSAVARSSASPVVETVPELTAENEDSFLMPRIVNVTSLATEEDKNLNLDVNKNLHITADVNSQASQPSLPGTHQEAMNIPPVEKAEASGRNEKDSTETTEPFLAKKEIVFPQIVNVSSLKESPESFATKLCTEKLSQSQAKGKQTDRRRGRQQSKDSTFQELTVREPKALGLEMELQKVSSAVQEAAPDASELMDMEENDDSDETLTSLLNEIAFLNQQLNDDASDVSELPNSLSSCFSPGEMESHRESATTDGSPFQFGPLGGSFKNFSIARESNDSISPLLLHLDNDELSNGNRNAKELSSESGALKIMLSSEAKHLDPSLSTINVGGSGKHIEPLSKNTCVSPPILQMKANAEAGNIDISWRPMPKLAPLGLKAANFLLESEGQNSKVMPVLAPVAAKTSSTEIKTAKPMTSPNEDNKTMPTLAPVVTKSK